MKKFVQVFSVLLFLLLCSSGVMAAPATGTVGNTIPTDVGNQTTVWNYNGQAGASASLTSLIGSSKVWYVSPQSEGSSSDVTINAESGTNWLVINPGNNGITLSLTSSISVSENAILNVVTIENQNKAANILSFGGAVLNNSGTVNFYGTNDNPNNCYLALQSTTSNSTPVVSNTGTVNTYSGGLNAMFSAEANGTTACISGGTVNAYGGLLRCSLDNNKNAGTGFSSTTQLNVSGATVLCVNQNGGKNGVNGAGLGTTNVTIGNNSLVAATDVTPENFPDADNCILVNLSKYNQITFDGNNNGANYTGAAVVEGNVTVNWGGDEGGFSNITFTAPTTESGQAPAALTVSDGSTLTIPSGSGVQVAEKSTAANSGTISVQSGGTFSSQGTTNNNGTIINNGTVTTPNNGTISNGTTGSYITGPSASTANKPNLSGTNNEPITQTVLAVNLSTDGIPTFYNVTGGANQTISFDLTVITNSGIQNSTPLTWTLEGNSSWDNEENGLTVNQTTGQITYTGNDTTGLANGVYTLTATPQGASSDAPTGQIKFTIDDSSITQVTTVQGN